MARLEHGSAAYTDLQPGDLWIENGAGSSVTGHQLVLRLRNGDSRDWLYFYAPDPAAVLRDLADQMMRLADRLDATADDDRDGVAVPGDSHPIPPPMAVAPYEYAEANCNHCLGGGLEIVDGDAVACRACGGLGAM